MTSASTTTNQRSSQANRRLTKAAFEAWLGRPAAGQEIEYYRGHLVWDRGSASRLSDRQRQALSRLADAVFSAAEEGRVHLVQHRNGPFDFSYLAIRAGRRHDSRRVTVPKVDRIGRHPPPLYMEIAP